MQGSDRRWLGAIAAAVAAVGALLPATALAQTESAAADPFAQGVVYLEADEVIDDREAGYVIARGNVEARYGDRLVRADELTYYPADGRVVAKGGVAVVLPDGSVTYADEVELKDDLTSGQALGVAVRMPNQGKVGARAFIRRDPTTNEFERAFYTACEPCAEPGEPTPRPTWRLRARKVTQDTKKQMIFYRDAVLEIKGVPVFYTPYFAHADPSAPRRSGFLIPSFGESSRTGTFFELPYYWAISKHQDLTLSPRVMSDAYPLLSFEHRRRFFSGGTILQGSMTYEQEFDDNGNAFGEEKFRGHIFGDGAFRISENWDWGFGVERVSDDLYFRRYDIDDEDKARGIYRRGSKRLLSQLFFVGQDDDFYASFAALAFQGLREGDDEDLFPVVTPLIDARAILFDDLLGGRVEGRASSAVLERSEGADSRRLTLEAEWTRPTILRNGVVATPFALARADYYDVNSVPFGSGTSSDTFGRALGLFGADLGYPLVRTEGSTRIILEPIAQLIVAPYGGNDERIPNEDSYSFDVDPAALLDHNRSTGYDVWEEGPRATVGGRATAQWGEQGGGASFFLGQSYRARDAREFAPVSGLGGSQTDIVGSASLAFDRRNSVTANFRIDDDTFDFQRFDLGAQAAYGPARFTGRYLKFDEALLSGRPKEEATLGAGLELTKNWGVFYEVNRDLDLDETRRAFIGLVFDDECTRFEIIYKQERTQDRLIGSGESIRLQLTLSTLGSFGSR